MAVADEFLAGVLSPEFQIDPYPLFSRMRSEAPMLELAPGEWFAFEFEPALAVLRDPRFSSDERRSNVFEQVRPRSRARMELPNLLFMDPPDHTRLRRMVVRSFTPSVVARLRSTTVQLVTDEIEASIRGRDTVDVIASLAYPIPIQLICALIGVPASDIAVFEGWSKVLSRSVDPGFLRDDALEIEIDDASAELYAYLSLLVEERRAQPRDDLLSALVADVDLSQLELLELMRLLLIAGHETTVNLIGNGLLALLSHRDQLRQLVAEPSLWDSAIDELLRFDSPVQLSQRIATEPIQIGGRLIQTGEQVVALLGSANRDPSAFADPDRLDLRRDAKRHVAFGGGIHHCLGAALARMEAEVVLRALITEFPAMELIAPPVRRPNFTLRGVSELLVSPTGT